MSSPSSAPDASACAPPIPILEDLASLAVPAAVILFVVTIVLAIGATRVQDYDLRRAANLGALLCLFGTFASVLVALFVSATSC